MLETAKTEWLTLFDENVFDVWTKEEPKFRKMGMLLYALKQEFDYIKEQKCKCADVISETSTSDLDECRGASNCDAKNSLVPYTVNSTASSTFSPDLFGEGDNDLTMTQWRQQSSPVLSSDNRRPNKFSKCKENVCLKSDYNKEDLILCTPKRGKLKNPFKISLNKDKNSDGQSATKLNDADDLTLLDITNSYDSFPKNKNSTTTDKPSSVMNKKSKLNENTRIEPSYPYVQACVRGKERQKLEGWSCKDCEKFYSGLNLNAAELKRLQNKCSKHRSKYAPIPSTPDGFWDLTLRKIDKKK